MKREDLARFAGTRLRITLVRLLVLCGGLALSLSGALQKIDPRWTREWVVPVLGGFTVVVLLLFAQRGLVGLPRCPHCKRLLSGWLLHIAIASGNCGYCGKSVEA